MKFTHFLSIVTIPVMVFIGFKTITSKQIQSNTKSNIIITAQNVEDNSIVEFTTLEFVMIRDSLLLWDELNGKVLSLRNDSIEVRFSLQDESYTNTFYIKELYHVGDMIWPYRIIQIL